MIDWHEYFYYDVTSKTGLRYKKDVMGGKDYKTVRMHAGDVAGYVRLEKRDGYTRNALMLQGKSYVVARIIWEMHFGELDKTMDIDHINGNSLDNTLENLRSVPKIINARNKKKTVKNTSGITGVYIHDNGFGKLYWTASWNEGPRKPRSKYFSIDKYGEDGAKRLAIAHREKMIDELNEKDFGYTERHGLPLETS